MKIEKTSQLTRDFKTNCMRAVEGEGNERKFILSFSSEEPYRRHWGMEILDHSKEAADLTRLSEIGCVLFNHKRDAVIGKVNRVWMEGQRGNAEIEFDEDEESEKIYQKVKGGTLKGVSVGYSVDSWEEILPGKKTADGKYEGPANIARKWTPFEISIVSVPADPTVGVNREIEEHKQIAQNRSDYKSLTFYEWQLKINKNMINRREKKK